MKIPNLRNLRKDARTQGFTLIELLVVISIIAILAGFALPVFTSAQKKGRITDSLSNCKQIGLALRMYSGDNDGAFPNTVAGAAAAGAAAAAEPTTANEALGNLMGKYTTSKKIFVNKTSKWCPASASAVAEDATTSKTLQAGQNDWLYVLGLSDTSDARYPLIATAATEASVPPTYTSDTTAKGGVWAGTDTVIGFCDGSARPVSGKEMDTTKPTAAFVKSPLDQSKNILEVSADQDKPWLTGCKVLQPSAK